MSDQTAAHRTPNRKPLVWGVSLAILAGVGLTWPEHSANTVKFVLWGLIVVAPIVVPGIVLAAWIIASGADNHIAGAFEGRTLRTVFAASLIGALTPVCGVTVLPLMAGLLAAGVPLAPIMAFWLSSPITDPAMLATTAATLGLSFARLCRECGGNSRSAPPGRVGMTQLRRLRQERRVRRADRGFPIRRPSASGSGRMRAAPTEAWARFPVSAGPSGS